MNDFRKSFNSQFNQQNPEPGSVPAFNSGNPVITKKDMLRERSAHNTGSNKQGTANGVNVKAGLNPYSYVPRSKQTSKRSNTQGKFSNTLSASMAQQ